MLSTHLICNGNALCKYADDTYLIIPAVNVDSRSAELYNVKEWALANNLKLNLTKSQEIIFTDHAMSRQESMHSCSAMDKHMQHSVFHTIAFLAFSCLAISTPATWCRIFMSRKFMSRIFSVPQITSNSSVLEARKS